MRDLFASKMEECLDIKDLEIKEEFYRIIDKTKDGDIYDILNAFFSSLENKISSLLDEGITKGVQYGVHNNTFSVIGYGGSKSNGDEINENTFFSFDSISKLVTSVITMLEVRDGKFSLNTSINEIDNSYKLRASIESILKFTAMIQTDRRIDGLSRKETISLLKACGENLKTKPYNYYQYNDIGYMILRQVIDDFLERLDDLLGSLDGLTYKWDENKDNITGGKMDEEYITPDPKGRDILFPGHTGLYGNIKGLMTMFDTLLENVLTSKEMNILFKQPYDDPAVYNKGSQLLGKNGSLQYMAKVAGIYRMPNGINDPNYSKLASCDLSNLTTCKAKASAGNCGSWVMKDDLFYEGYFGSYTGGLLTNPYSYIRPGLYEESHIPSSNLEVNSKGFILGYQTKLNKYKDIIAKYGILLELITEYIKSIDENSIEKKYVLSKKIKH